MMPFGGAAKPDDPPVVSIDWQSPCDVCGAADATWRGTHATPGDESNGAGFRKTFPARVIACKQCGPIIDRPPTARATPRPTPPEVDSASYDTWGDRLAERVTGIVANLLDRRTG